MFLPSYTLTLENTRLNSLLTPLHHAKSPRSCFHSQRDYFAGAFQALCLVLLAAHRWNPQLGGVPSFFCEVGVQEKIGHNLVSCGLMWLTGFMGQPLFALGLTCVCFVSRDLLSLKGVPVPTAIVFINFQTINWRAQPKSTKKIHAGLKLEWSLYDEW